MRIATPHALTSLTSGGSHRSGRTGLLRRLNRYTLWAFNPQPELTTRYDRAA